MNLTFARKPSLYIRKTNIGAQKIDSSTFKTSKILIVDFQVEDMGGRPRLFQEIFLVVNTKFEVILGMSFLIISNTNVAFSKGLLTWMIYITNKTLPSIEQVQLVNLKEFVIVALDADSKTFIVHVANQEQEEMLVHSKKQAQIRASLFNKTPTEVLVEYSDYSNVFSMKNVAELPENTRMNNHAIELEIGKQPPFKPI